MSKSLDFHTWYCKRLYNKHLYCKNVTTLIDHRSFFIALVELGGG